MTFLLIISHALIQLKLVPLMCIFELADIIFFIKSPKTPTSNFNISDYVSFCHGTTRSSSGFKLIHHHSPTNKASFYFNRLPRLWNSLPIIDHSLSTNTTPLNLEVTLSMRYEPHSAPHANVRAHVHEGSKMRNLFGHARYKF